MMWGAMLCVIKTAAARENKSIKSHKGLGEYVKELAQRDKDKELFDSFAKAGLLHSNFYESDTRPLAQLTQFDQSMQGSGAK